MGGEPLVWGFWFLSCFSASVCLTKQTSAFSEKTNLSLLIMPCTCCTLDGFAYILYERAPMQVQRPNHTLGNRLDWFLTDQLHALHTSIQMWEVRWRHVCNHIVFIAFVGIFEHVCHLLASYWHLSVDYWLKLVNQYIRNILQYDILRINEFTVNQ